MAYLIHILVLVGIYSILTVSLDMIVSQLGLLSLAQAGFFGVGAYSSAILSLHRPGSFWEGVSVGVILAVIISLSLSISSSRLQADYFAIATFGVQLILFSTFNNCIPLTGGSSGIFGVQRPTVFGHPTPSSTAYIAIVAPFVILSFCTRIAIMRSPFGRVLRAIREDEVFAQSLGKNTLRFKMICFAVSASLAALAGSLYAHYVTYIDPTTFSASESIFVVSMVIAGGPGRLAGPLLGAVVLVGVPEVLRFLGLPTSVGANIRQMVYGATLVVIMFLQPRRLTGDI